MLTRLLFPPCAAALHSGFEETLAGCLDVATTQRQAKSARPGVVHTIGVNAMTPDIGDGRMDGVIRADTPSMPDAVNSSRMPVAALARFRAAVMAGHDTVVHTACIVLW